MRAAFLIAEDPDDKDKPTITLVSPADGDTVGGSFTVDASASDTVGVARMDFWVNNTLLYSSTTAPYGFQWDTTMLADGLYIFRARAWNNDGKASSTDVSVTVDNQ